MPCPSDPLSTLRRTIAPSAFNRRPDSPRSPRLVRFGAALKRPIVRHGDGNRSTKTNAPNEPARRIGNTESVTMGLRQMQLGKACRP